MELPKRIWITPGTYVSDKKVFPADIKYIRHDRYVALLEAAMSLEHWLFEIVHNADTDTPEVFADAQLAIDKYNRYCDGKTEEE